MRPSHSRPARRRAWLCTLVHTFVDLRRRSAIALILHCWVALIVQPRSHIHYCQLGQRGHLVRPETRKRNQLQITRRDVLSEGNLWRCKSRHEFAALRFAPFTAVIAHQHAVLTNVALMFAMVLSRH